MLKADSILVRTYYIVNIFDLKLNISKCNLIFIKNYLFLKVDLMGAIIFLAESVKCFRNFAFTVVKKKKEIMKSKGHGRLKHQGRVILRTSRNPVHCKTVNNFGHLIVEIGIIIL